MDHNELAQRLERRLDRIEEKLDSHLTSMSTNKADIQWVKGYIRLSLSTMVAIIAGVITTMIRVFVKN